jgi:hypothetical protein
MLSINKDITIFLINQAKQQDRSMGSAPHTVQTTEKIREGCYRALAQRYKSHTRWGTRRGGWAKGLRQSC